jgi:hypothetical protein
MSKIPLEMTELVPGVFVSDTSSYYVRDSKTGKKELCKKEAVEKLIKQYGSIEELGRRYISPKTSYPKPPKKTILKSAPEKIEITLLNDSGEAVKKFVSNQVRQQSNTIVYSFDHSEFDHCFIYVIKVDLPLKHPKNKVKEVKARFFNGQTQEVYEAVYDKETDSYCILDSDATRQIISIEIEH